MDKKHSQDWDRRIQQNYRLWMSDGVASDEEMFNTGKRDLDLLIPETDTEQLVFLEIGCGVGRLLLHAARRFNRVLGVDISRSALEIARKFLKGIDNVQLILTADYKLYSVPDESVDIVGSFATLFSVPTEVLCGYLLEANRVLKPGGKIAIQLYCGAEFVPEQSDSLSLRSYSKTKLDSTFRAAGFDDIVFQEDLQLPVKTDLEPLETKAVIVRAIKTRRASTSLDELVSFLKPETVFPNSEKQYELAMYYDLFKKALSIKDFEQAFQAADLCIQLANEIGAVEVAQDIQRLLKNIKPTNVVVVNEEKLQFRKVKNVMVPYYKGYPLSNPKDPEQFEVNLARRVESQNVCLFGVGCGILVDKLISAGKRVFVVEPIEELREIFKNFSDYFVSLDEEALKQSEFSLLVNPCYIPLFSDQINYLKEIQAGYKIRKRFTVAVVSPIDGGSYPISKYTARAFSKLGYRVLYFDFSPFQGARDSSGGFYLNDAKKSRYLEEISKLCSNTLVEACKLERPQIVFALSQAPLTPEALEALRKEGIITAMWFVEDFRRFSYWQHLAQFYDYFFLIQKEPALSEIRKLCRNVKYVPVACDPEIHRRVELSSEERLHYGSDVSFMGYGYPNRVRTFAKFAGYNIKIWGKMWPMVGPFKKIAIDCLLPPEEYVKIFQASKINLNLHSSTEKDFIDPYGDFVNPRTFEIASVGAFQLCDRRSLLAELFDDSIPTFETVQELKDKVDYFLERDEEREYYAKKSHSLAVSKHTYQKRVVDMMQKIVACDEDKLLSNLSLCKWNRVLSTLDPGSAEYRLFAQAFESGAPFDFDAISTKHLLGKQEPYTREEFKLLFLHHCNRSSKRFVKYA